MIKQHRFCCDALGVDNMVLIKENLIVINEACVHTNDILAVYQMAHAHKSFGASSAQLVLPLENEQSMFRAEDKVSLVVQYAFFDDHRGKFAISTNGLMTYPSYFLHPPIAGEHFVTCCQCFNCTQRAVMY